MQTSLLWFFVFYVLVAFVAVLGFFRQDSRFFWLAGINFLALFFFALISFFVKKQEKSLEKEKEEHLKSDHVRHPHQFVKYPYQKSKSHKKSQSFFAYFLFFSLLLFAFSVVDLLFFQILGNVIWIFPILYLVSLLFAGTHLIENKLKLFWYSFSFYLFLFLSSLIVGLFVYGTLTYAFFPFLIFSAFLVSFLFFFVGYLFIKNQWLRYFVRLIYTKIYFVVIIVFGLWSLALTITNSWTIKISDYIHSASNYIYNMFVYEENTDKLLFTGAWEIVSSGVIIDTWNDNVDIYEATGEVVTSTGLINDVFLSEEETSIIETGILENEMIQNIKSDLGIKDTDTISMIVALEFLMKKNDIELSSSTTTNFTYVSKINPLYPYWKTAYDNKMIWSRTNPSTKITCETYQVFKGMLLDRPLQYTSANVKKVFWDEATKQDVLNGCEYGKLLKGENL